MYSTQSAQSAPSKQSTQSNAESSSSFLDEKQKRQLIDILELLSEERIARASEYETWAFGYILRENIPWYDKNCRQTIQACYETLLAQPSSPSNSKVSFAIAFFAASYHQIADGQADDEYEEEEEEHDSDVEEWWGSRR